MSELIPPSEGIKEKHAAKVMKSFYKNFQLRHFVLQDVTNESPIMTEVKVELEMIKGGSVETKARDIKMIREDGEGSGDPEGKWYIAQWPTLGSGYRYQG